jgi:hypothetical protein
MGCAGSKEDSKPNNVGASNKYGNGPPPAFQQERPTPVNHTSSQFQCSSTPTQSLARCKLLLPRACACTQHLSPHVTMVAVQRNCCASPSSTYPGCGDVLWRCFLCCSDYAHLGNSSATDCCATHPMCCANTRVDVGCSAFVVCALTLLLFLRCFRSCCPTGCLYITLHPHFACRPPHRRSRDAQPKDAEQCTETAATNSDPGARTDGSDWTLPGRCAARSSSSAHHCDHHQPPVSKKRAPHTHTRTHSVVISSRE